jgi:hypothetical protein
LIEWSIHKTGNKIADWAVHSGAVGPFVMQKPEGYKQMQTPRGKLFAFDAEGQHILTCAQNGGQMYTVCSFPFLYTACGFPFFKT